MKYRFLISKYYCVLFFILNIFMVSFPINAADSALSLRDAIREVAEVTNVLPLDVYAGTTLSEYRNWNCRYDLTYSEFRPNYALYEIARNASVSEVLECVEELADMPAKEKALTCAALIAFVESQREREARGIVPTTGLNDDEKRLVLQTLEKELDDHDVAFSKADNAALSALWEKELRNDCGDFMRNFRSRVTATSACSDIFLTSSEKVDPRDLETNGAASSELYERYSESRVKSHAELERRRFTAWNTDDKQLPVDFLCALVLAQAAYSREQFCNSYRNSEEVEEGTLFEVLEKAQRDAVVECLEFHRLTFTGEHKTLLENREVPRKNGRLNGECLIMNAFLRTQFIAARYGTSEGEIPVCGNSSDKDVGVSDVTQKAIGVLLNETPRAVTTCALEPQDESEDVEKQERAPLLGTIRTIAAENDMFFSIPFLIDLFNTFEQKKEKKVSVNYPVCLADDYERCRPLLSFYEITKQATHDDIVECLSVFRELSSKEKAFVLAAASLYILRSESSDELEETVKGEEFRPLTSDEKKVFAQSASECKNDDSVVFEGVEGSMEEWSSSFRKVALEYQKKLGKWNPYYVYSPETKERWERFCNEVPTMLLYSMLSMETCCNLYDLRVFSGIDIDPSSSNAKTETAAWIKYVTDENVLSEIKLMRYYLYRNNGLTSGLPGRKDTHSASPSPRIVSIALTVRLSDVAHKIRYSSKVFRDLFPEK